MGELKTLLRLGALALMWGSSFLWIKIGLAAFTPVQLVLIRTALGSAVLIGLCYAGGDRLPADRRIWRHLLVAALFHNAVPFLLIAVGEQTVSSGVTGVLNATVPLWTLVMALLVGVERRLDPPKLAGLIVGLAGSVLIFAPWQESDLLSWGALACVAAAVSYGFVYVYEGKHLSAPGSSPVALAGAQMSAATGFTMLAMPIGGTAPVHLSAGPVIAVLVLGVFSTGIAFALNYRLLATESAVTASVVGYLLPVVSLVLGALVLGESLNPRVLTGVAVVLAGVALTRVRRRVVAQTSLRSEAQRESS
ncbi:DMT family transporter [Amycolatopsis deserti]|uniref:DMT family transporter n=1 Tax=Amycolatopsis deserti TaxID=185696 RepID=UPI00174865B0|nr:EamA family transporter [Amycolatopsis deserti]